jgi:hypothetical protein
VIAQNPAENLQHVADTSLIGWDVVQTEAQTYFFPLSDDLTLEKSGGEVETELQLKPPYAEPSASSIRDFTT